MTREDWSWLGLTIGPPVLLVGGPMLLFGDIADSVAVLIGLTAIGVMVISPRAALVIFVASICFVPYWFGLRLGGYWPPGAIVGILVLACAIFRTGFIQLKRLTPFDIMVGIFAIACIALGVAGMSNRGHVLISVGQWTVAYLVARFVANETDLDFVYQVLAVAFSVVAVFTLIEFATGHNIFAGTLPGSGGNFSTIGQTQLRGGEIRAEFSFGHSIPLANSLAMAVPFTLSARLPPWIKVVFVSLISCATLVTLSRSGLITLALAIVLSVWAISSERMPWPTKAATIGAFSVLAFVTVPWLTTTFARAGDEAGRSGRYRSDLMQMFPLTKPLGLADGYSENGTGSFLWNGLYSIDNAFLRLSVNFGYLAMVPVLLIFVLAIILVAVRRASPATVSLAAVTPALFTVALITQFGAFVFFCAGIASVAWLRRENSRDQHDRPNPQMTHGIHSRLLLRR